MSYSISYYMSCLINVKETVYSTAKSLWEVLCPPQKVSIDEPQVISI